MRARSAGFALKTISHTPLFQRLIEYKWYQSSAVGGGLSWGAARRRTATGSTRKKPLMGL